MINSVSKVLPHPVSDESKNINSLTNEILLGIIFLQQEDLSHK